MTSAHPAISTKELLAAGWQIVATPSHREASASIQTLYSQIPDWPSLSWADRTYYQAKYGFDDSGLLSIDLQNPDPQEETWDRSRYTARQAIAAAHSARHRPDHQPFPLPGHEMPGSQARLRTLLRQPELEHIRSKHDEDATAHIGPDGSVIYSNTLGWGIPDHQERPRNCYEFDYEPKHLCQWNPKPYGMDQVPHWANEADEE